MCPNQAFRGVSRRSVAKGVAWTTPALLIASAAPTMAASGPAMQRTFNVGRSSCGAGAGNRLTVTTDNNTGSYRIINATGQTITNVQASILVQKSVVDGLSQPLTWTSNSSNWSAPVRDTSGTIFTDGSGIQYYRYYSNLFTAVPAPVGGTITFPLINWASSCDTNLNSVWVNGRGQAQVNNGGYLTNIGAYRQL